MPIDINQLIVEKGKCPSSLANIPVGGDPEKVRASQKARFANVEVIDEIIELHQKLRTRTYPNEISSCLILI